ATRPGPPTTTSSTASPPSSWGWRCWPSPGSRPGPGARPRPRRSGGPPLRQREGDREDRAHRQAVDRERRERVAAEEPQQELDGEVRGDRGAGGAHGGGTAYAVALGAEQLGQLQRGRRADDRGGEQERVAGGVLVG